MLAVSICAFDSTVLKTLRTMGQAVFNAEHTGYVTTAVHISRDPKRCEIM